MAPCAADFSAAAGDPAAVATIPELVRGLFYGKVPARIGIYVRGPVNIGLERVTLEINPVTSDDMRLRTVNTSGTPSFAFRSSQEVVF